MCVCVCACPPSYYYYLCTRPCIWCWLSCQAVALLEQAKRQRPAGAGIFLLLSEKRAWALPTTTYDRWSKGYRTLVIMLCLSFSLSSQPFLSSYGSLATLFPYFYTYTLRLPAVTGLLSPMFATQPAKKRTVLLLFLFLLQLLQGYMYLNSGRRRTELPQLRQASRQMLPKQRRAGKEGNDVTSTAASAGIQR